MSHNDSLIMNEMNPSLLDYEMLEFRTSKRDLNRNAVKFHLTELTRATIRYEVVYKNLVRDIRKYFSNDLNAMNIQQNRHCRPTEFSQFLKLYTKYTLGDYAQKLGMDINVIVFNLGSIINPKTMLKLSNNNSQAKLEIFQIFNYLYKFSLERLNQFLNNESLFLLLCEYLRVNKFTRVHQNANMKKYRRAYYEACSKMLATSKFSAKFR